jgi:hypothetical protein
LKSEAGRAQDRIGAAMQTPLRSYEEFWPLYVSQHLHPVNRALHFAGTTLVLVCLLAGLLVSPLLLLAMPIAGYGFAWAGHFFVEKNKPATFSYPLWSLRGDFRMYRLMLMGRMAPEVERAARLFAQPA